MPAPRDGRLRILIVDPSGLLWGSERALLDLLRHVDVKRYDVSLASPHQSQLGERVRQLGFRVEHGPLGMLHNRGKLARLKAFLWMAKTIIRTKPRVVHVNEAGVTALVSAARLGKRIPVVAHVRLWDDAILLAQKPASFGAPMAFIAISRFIASALGNRATRIVTDPFDADAFANQAAINSGAPPSPNVSSVRSTVIMVGRICREKRQDLLLEAAVVLGDRPIDYLFVGGVPPESPVESAYYSDLIRRSESAMLKERVKFVGNRPDVAKLIKASDVLVLASDNEPFGRVLLEALSLGVPVIAPNRGGPTEIIGDNERGILFEHGNARSLADAILKTLDNRAASAESAIRGREWVLRECAPALHAARVQDIWDEMTSEAGVAA